MPDSGLTTPNGNPVVANSAGRFSNIFLDPTITYKVVLEDQFGNEIWTADPVVGAGSAAGPTITLAEAGAPAGTPNAIVLYTDDGRDAEVQGRVQHALQRADPAGRKQRRLILSRQHHGRRGRPSD